MTFNVSEILANRLLLLHVILAIIVLLFFILVLSTSLLLTMIFLGKNADMWTLAAAAIVALPVGIVFSITALPIIQDKPHHLLVKRQISK